MVVCWWAAPPSASDALRLRARRHLAPRAVGMLLAHRPNTGNFIQANQANHVQFCTVVGVLERRFNLGLPGTKQGLQSRWTTSPGSEPAVTSKRRLTFVRTINGGFIITRGFCALACCAQNSVLGRATVEGEGGPRDPTWAGLL